MDRALFFASVRTSLLGPKLDQSEVDGCNAILDAMAGLPISYVAYALATAYLETNHSMQPIKEMGGDAYFTRRYDPTGQRPDIAAQLGNTQRGDGARYCGRGYVQVTGRRNYTRAGAELGVDLVGNPDLAMDPKVAAGVLRYGMTEGWFTGKRLAAYLSPTGLGSLGQFTQARRIINGEDRAEEIARYALAFQAALSTAGA